MAESSQSTSSASYSRFSSSSTSFAAETPETVSDCEVDSGEEAEVESKISILICT